MKTNKELLKDWRHITVCLYQLQTVRLIILKVSELLNECKDSHEASRVIRAAENILKRNNNEKL